MRKRSRSKRLAAARADHEEWLRSMGIEPSKRPRLRGVGFPDLKVDSSNIAPTSDQIAGNGNKRDIQRYTGDYIIGVTTTHKSNIVPITSKAQAIDVANMRRGEGG